MRSTKVKKRPTTAKRRNVPRSFEAALKQGWQVHEQIGGWTFRSANKRDGFLLLSQPKDPRTLLVRFVALYELRKPYFL